MEPNTIQRVRSIRTVIHSEEERLRRTHPWLAHQDFLGMVCFLGSLAIMASVAAWYLLASLPDNPHAECLTPGFVEGALRDSGFVIEGTAPMLAEITQLTLARRIT